MKKNGFVIDGLPNAVLSIPVNWSAKRTAAAGSNRLHYGLGQEEKEQQQQDFIWNDKRAGDSSFGARLEEGTRMISRYASLEFIS